MKHSKTVVVVLVSNSCHIPYCYARDTVDTVMLHRIIYWCMYRLFIINYHQPATGAM